MTRINFTKRALEALAVPADRTRYVYDEQVRGLAARIVPTGTVTFVLYRKIEGRPERVTLGRFPDLKIEAARGLAGELNGRIAKGENPADERRGIRLQMTLRDLFTEYLERHSKANKRTWDEDQSKFQQYLTADPLPESKRHKNRVRGLNLADRKLRDIKRPDLAELHARISRKNPVTANRVLALVSSMYGRAIEWGRWEGMNPAIGLKLNREQSRDRFLSTKEVPQFFEAVQACAHTTFRDYVLISLLTGARRANVLEMQWPDVDLDRGEWRIPRTKNGTPQLVPLCPEALRILLDRKPKDSEDPPTGWVFPGRSKKGNLAQVDKAWRKLLTAAKLSELRIHDLRRTLGSWQARTGASLAIIGKSLNHKDPSTTAIYARLDIDPVRAAMERATSAILAASKPKAEGADALNNVIPLPVAAQSA